MKEKSTLKTIKNDETIYQEIKDLIHQTRNEVYHYANHKLVLMYWTIGKILYEKCGESEQGIRRNSTIHNISASLVSDFGSGFSERNLRYMRNFYLSYPLRQTLSADVSWSHYLLLLRVDNPLIRQFYEQETISNNWSVRQLERQIKSHYYERIVSNQTNKHLPLKINSIDYTPIIKDPYILEFLQLPNDYYEKDLEDELSNKLSMFLLELGKGYSYVGRQVSIKIDRKAYFIDLVFYNSILHCHVLFELKRNSLKSQDIGQLQMYVNYWKQNMSNSKDTPPIGILLCTNKNETVVEYTLANDNDSIYVSKYLDYLPSKDELKQLLNHDKQVFYE